MVVDTPRLGLGAEPHKESADAARSLAVAVRMERKITGRRKQTVADRTGMGCGGQAAFPGCLYARSRRVVQFFMWRWMGGR